MLGKFYHNTTAYYNGYFNANVLLEEAQATLASTYQDNYTRILDVYDYVNVEKPEVVAEDMDRAIEKVSVVATLHRPSHWVDDCYLLVGKAQYMKHDYETAEETLEFFRENYSPEVMKRRKLASDAKAKARARDKKRRQEAKERERAREERIEEQEEKREERQEKAEEQRKERKKSAKERQKDRRKEAKERQKERQKEAKQRKKEREREAKARQKARKKGKKLPPKKKPDSDEAAADQPSGEEEVTPENEVSTPEEEKPQSEQPQPEEEVSDEEADEGEETDAEEVAEEESTEKEEDERSNYFLKHRPAYADGMYWLGRVYTERELYADAMRAFSEATAQVHASPETLAEVPVAQAHLFLKQEDYASAIPYLRSAITLSKSRHKRARYYYILGQIYQRERQMAQAVDAFRAAIKQRPPYVMEFNARLNLTLNEWMAGGKTVAEAQSDLEKLLKDGKNEEYKDRIYFALAEIDLSKPDTLAALANLKESVSYSTTNTSQRTEAHLKLADLYFSQEDYVEAKTYYDKAVGGLLVTDDRYPRASALSKNLTEIAKNIRIITLQDSLLMIAGMSERDRIALAEKIKEDQRAQQAEAEAKANAGPSGPAAVGPGSFRPRNSAQGVTQSNFFAYDDKTKSRAMRDFRDNWGDRVLEDNWRRSNRNASFAVQEEESAEEVIETSLSNSEIQEIFKAVPFAEEAQAQSHQQIQDAMIALGRLYRERLENNEKTIEVLDDLLSRYPDTEYELDAWYFLHLAHLAEGHRSEAQRYFDLIVSKYPESTYARVLSDPSYLGESQEKERRLNTFYEETYDAFTAGQFAVAWDRLGQVDTLFGVDNRLQTKFALLRAMTVGNLQGKEAYVDALKDLVSKFPDTEEEARAKEILRLLGDKSVSPQGLPNEKTKDGEYNLDPENTHYVIISWDLNEVELKDAQNAVNAFNRKYFRADRLRLSSNIFLSVDVPLMVVRRFADQAKAMDYYELTQKYLGEFIGKEGIPVTVYPVTQQNYRVILKNRSFASYAPFFEANYQ